MLDYKQGAAWRQRRCVRVVVLRKLRLGEVKVLTLIRTSMNPGDLADAYLRHFATKRGEDLWAFEKVNELVSRDANDGWQITRILVNDASSDEALAYVAAGPLEDLLKKHGPAVIGWVEEESRLNDRLRLALSGVWLRRDDPTWHRWYSLMWEYGFAEGKRMPL
jgi:hypothetical protein